MGKKKRHQQDRRVRLKDEPEGPLLPFVFRHQHGTFKVWATTCEWAVKRGEAFARGMPITPTFPVPAVCN